MIKRLSDCLTREREPNSKARRFFRGAQAVSPKSFQGSPTKSRQDLPILEPAPTIETASY